VHPASPPIETAFPAVRATSSSSIATKTANAMDGGESRPDLEGSTPA
jgi:hypothetical protein